MSGRDWLKLLLCLVTVGPAIVVILQHVPAFHHLTYAEQEFSGMGAEVVAVLVAVAWMLVSDRRERDGAGRRGEAGRRG